MDVRIAATNLDYERATDMACARLVLLRERGGGGQREPHPQTTIASYEQERVPDGAGAENKLQRYSSCTGSRSSITHNTSSAAIAVNT